MMIKPGEEIHLAAGQRFRLIDVVPFEEEDSRFVGLLQVEAGQRATDGPELMGSTMLLGTT